MSDNELQEREFATVCKYTFLYETSSQGSPSRSIYPGERLLFFKRDGVWASVAPGLAQEKQMWILYEDLIPDRRSGFDSLLKPTPIPMVLTCPACGERHIDEGDFATKPHHTHACQCCGLVWRPALVDTVGVRFLPGYKDAP